MKKLTISLVASAALATSAMAYSTQFEAPKDTRGFSGLETNVGAAFALTYQVMGENDDLATQNTVVDHSISSSSKYIRLAKPQMGLILPTADALLRSRVAKGLNINLVWNASSHHHDEGMVAGGYATVDSLDFIKKGFLSNIMKYVTFNVGYWKTAVGDAQAYFSSNAQTVDVPFVANTPATLTQETPHLEVWFRDPKSGALAVVGVATMIADSSAGTAYGAGDAGNYTNLNAKATLKGYHGNESNAGKDGPKTPAYYIKAGIDKRLNKKTRVRFTESIIIQGRNENSSFYNNHKAGTPSVVVGTVKSTTDSQYTFKPMPGKGKSSFLSATAAYGEFNFLPTGSTNLFAQYEFGNSKASKYTGNQSYQPAAGDGDVKTKGTNLTVIAMQNFMNDKLYGALRYAAATSKTDGSDKKKSNLMSVTGGWRINKNATFKVEYDMWKDTNKGHYFEVKNDHYTNTAADEAKFSALYAQVAVQY